MKKVLEIIFLAFISILACSCHKFTIGDTARKALTVETPFQIVEFRDDVNVTLLHGTPEHPAGTVLIEAGTNLIDNIHAEVEPTEEDNGYGSQKFNKLVITNDNSLNYLHSYDYTIEMTVYYDSLQHLIFHSNATDIHTDTLRGFNCKTTFTHDTLTWDSLASNLLIELEGGAGNFNVLANCCWVRTKFIHGTSNIKLCGFADMVSTYADYDCHGVIDESEMEADYHFITSYGTNTISAKAFNTFNAKNYNVGRIYYVKYQKPAKVTIWGHFDENHHWIPQQIVDTVYSCPLNLIKSGSNILPMP